MSCCHEDCVQIDAEKLDTVIYGAKYRISELMEEKTKGLFYGYPRTHSRAERKASLLLRYKRILEDYWKKIYFDACACLERCEIESVIEKTLDLVGMDCSLLPRTDQIVDESQEYLWVAQNPYCVSMDKWEQLVHRVCISLDLTLKVEKQEACDLVFEIVREEIPCDVMVAISYYVSEVCDQDLIITRTEEECETDFTLLVEEFPDCNVTLELFKTLTLDCNLSFDIIRAIIKEDLSIQVDEDGNPIVATNLNVYPLSSMSFASTLDSKNVEYLKSLGVDVSKSEFYKNPDKFIKKLSSDYRKK